MSILEVPRPTGTPASESALTVVNRSVEIGEATLVYRCSGESRSDEPPLLCLQHFHELRIYTDAGPGFLDQYPEPFGDHVRAFLNGA